MRLRWLAAASEDLRDIDRFIRRDSPSAARRMRRLVREHTRALAQFPEMGRASEFSDLRELVIAGTPYVVRYRVVGDSVEVLRVWDGRRAP